MIHIYVITFLSIFYFIFRGYSFSVQSMNFLNEFCHERFCLHNTVKKKSSWISKTFLHLSFNSEFTWRKKKTLFSLKRIFFIICESTMFICVLKKSKILGRNYGFPIMNSSYVLNHVNTELISHPLNSSSLLHMNCLLNSGWRLFFSLVRFLVDKNIYFFIIFY